MEGVGSVSRRGLTAAIDLFASVRFVCGKCFPVPSSVWIY